LRRQLVAASVIKELIPSFFSAYGLS